MTMLQKATNKMAYAKVGIYGTAGAGKTHTAAKIAIGLHQFAKCTKPVGMFDTEPAASYIIPMFEKAGIEFLVYDQSRALKDLMMFMDEAEESCSIVIIDSITHVWRDAQESYLMKLNETRKKPIYKLEFHHWRPIKSNWAEFSDRFLSSKLHMIICGRAGQIYTYQQNEETGKKELITDGSRMATEKELGHEPSLLIEMVRNRTDGKTVNRALIEKDRADKINGNEIDMPEFKDLLPHFEALNIGGAHFESMDQRNSADMYQEEGSDSWAHEQRQRAMWSEEIIELLKKHYPAQTASDKEARQAMLEKHFHTRSWTRVENTDSAELKFQCLEMQAYFESIAPAVKAPNTPDEEEDPTLQIAA